MRILAIDPGYERLGLAVLEKVAGKESIIYSECFKTKPNLPEEERFFLIGQKIELVIKKFKPQTLATEKLFFSVNKKTALLVAQTLGVILYIAKKSGLNTQSFHPADIKIAITGNGRADKKALYYMVKKLVKMPDKKMIDDEVDAICLGLTFFAHNPK